MRAFSKRNTGYKTGVILLFLSSVIFIIGFCTPFWSKKTLPDIDTGLMGMAVTYHEGLWMLCVASTTIGGGTETSCESLSFFGGELWQWLVPVLECVCLVCLLLSCVYALAVNCRKSVPGPRSRILEVLSGFGGFTGLVGAATYAALRNDISVDHDYLDTNADSIHVDDPMDKFRAVVRTLLGGASFKINDGDWSYDWALFLVACGSFFSVIGAMLVTCFNGKQSQHPSPTFTLTMPTVSVVQNDRTNDRGDP